MATELHRRVLEPRGKNMASEGNHHKWYPLFLNKREEVSSQEDELQALRDEARASKEAIGVLKVQVEELKKEKETL